MKSQSVAITAGRAHASRQHLEDVMLPDTSSSPKGSGSKCDTEQSRPGGQQGRVIEGRGGGGVGDPGQGAGLLTPPSTPIRHLPGEQEGGGMARGSAPGRPFNPSTTHSEDGGRSPFDI